MGRPGKPPHAFHWVSLDTTYACGGIKIVANTGYIVEACPIYRRFEGRFLKDVIAELQKKKVFRQVVN